MATVGEAWVDIKPSAKGFGRDLSGQIDGEVGAAGKSAGSKFGTALKVGALAAIGGAIAVGKFLGGALEEARESAVIGARTENVIKSMGNAAKISAEDVGKMAGRISALTGVDDEMIQSGQNMLLTFGNISNEVDGKFTGTFDRATALMVDMSRAMGTDTKGAAIQLGKALNDPIKGVSAMARSGVSFTEQQKEQIKTLQESGDILGAQNIILGEVEKQFGGAAAAMATPADRLKTTYGNLKEQIGTALIPIADKFINVLLDAAPTVSSALAQIGPILGKLGEFFLPLIGTLRDVLQPVIERVFNFLKENTGVLQAVGLALVAFVSPVAAVALGLAALYQRSATFREIIAQVAQFITGTVVPALVNFGQYLYDNLYPVFLQVVGVIRDQVVPILVTFGQFIMSTLVPAVVNIVKAVAEKLRPAFEALVEFYRGTLLPALQALLAKFKEYQPTIQKVIEVVVKIIGKLAEFAATIISFVLPKVLALVTFFIQKVIPTIGDVIGVIADIIGWIVDMGKEFVDAVQKVAEFVKGVKEKIGNALDIIKGLPGEAASALGDLSRYLYEKGRALIQGLIDGIKSMVGAVGDAIGGVADKVKGFLPGSPVKEGPLTSWNNGGAGKRLMELLAGGISASEKKVAESMAKVLDKVIAVTQEKFDKVRSVVDSIRSAFDSLASSVAGAFSGDLFQAATGADFFSNAVSQIRDIGQIKAALKTLRGYGLSGDFLAQLFASGNGALILDLAAGSRSDAQFAAAAFQESNRVAARLGVGVADARYGDQLDKQISELRNIRKELEPLQTLAKDLGKALNGAAGAGGRNRK